MADQRLLAPLPPAVHQPPQQVQLHSQQTQEAALLDLVLQVL
jgi:hypothetical protein